MTKPSVYILSGAQQNEGRQGKSDEDQKKKERHERVSRFSEIGFNKRLLLTRGKKTPIASENRAQGQAMTLGGLTQHPRRCAKSPLVNGPASEDPQNH